MAARIPASPAPTTTTSCLTIRPPESSSCRFPEHAAYQSPWRVGRTLAWPHGKDFVTPVVRVPMWRNCSKLGRGHGTTVAFCDFWRRRGENGLSDAGGAPGPARRSAAGAARAGQGDGQGAYHELRRRERHDDGALALDAQHLHRR